MSLDIPYATVALALFVVVPVIATVLNIVSQLLPKQDPSLPPVVFHWFPIVGSTIAYGMDPVRFLFNCREQYGDVFTFVLAGRKITVALGPKGNNFVLGGRTSHVSAEEVYTSVTTPVFGKGVVYDVPNATFMEQKRFIKYGLSTENLRAYVPLIVNEVENLLEKAPTFAAYQSSPGKWGQFPAMKTMSELTIYTASRTLQGKEVREGVDGSFADLYHDLDGGFQPINFILPGLPLPMNIRRDRAHKKMSDFYMNIIKQRRVNGAAEEYDMLGALMDQSYKDGRALSDREIAHMMIALLMAGQHTSSATSSWAFLHLANRADVWEQLYQEQVAFFGSPDGSLSDIQYEDIRNLPILDSVIRETLRVHPPIHTIMRYVKADLAVPPTFTGSPSKKEDAQAYVVPKGHLILASPALSQVDPLIWKDASVWEPSRWSDPEGVAVAAYNEYENKGGEKVDYGFGAVSKGTESPYQPFGAGRHRCIGEQFAYVQLGTIIATFVRKLHLKIDEVPKANHRSMVVVPEAPDNISYCRRS